MHFGTAAFLAATIAISLVQSENAKNSTKGCQHLKNLYGVAHSLLIQCAVDHAEPVTICQGCLVQYLAVGDAFGNLRNGLDVDNTTACWPQFVDRDRLNLVLTVHAKSEELWTAAACSACYVELADGKLSNQTNHFTTDFFVKKNKTDECIRDNQDNTCTICGGAYAALNDMYNAAKATGSEDAMCFDIRDAMNKTRLTWSKDLKCCRDRHASLLVFLVCTAVIGLIPVGFYAGFFVYQRRREAAEYVTNLEPDQPSRTTPPAVTTVHALPATAENGRLQHRFLNDAADESDDSDNEAPKPSKQPTKPFGRQDHQSVGKLIDLGSDDDDDELMHAEAEHVNQNDHHHKPSLEKKLNKFD